MILEAFGVVVVIALAALGFANLVLDAYGWFLRRRLRKAQRERDRLLEPRRRKLDSDAASTSIAAHQARQIKGYPIDWRKPRGTLERGTF